MRVAGTCNSRASLLTLKPSGFIKSSRRISPGWTVGINAFDLLISFTVLLLAAVAKPGFGPMNSIDQKTCAYSSNGNRRFPLHSNSRHAKQNRSAIDRLFELSADLCDRPSGLPADFREATPKCVNPWPREAEATFVKRPARWRENACCAGNEKVLPLPWR